MRVVGRRKNKAKAKKNYFAYVLLYVYSVKTYRMVFTFAKEQIHWVLMF